MPVARRSTKIQQETRARIVRPGLLNSPKFKHTVSAGAIAAAHPLRGTFLPKNNTFIAWPEHTFPQFTYIHKSVYGSSAFA